MSVHVHIEWLVVEGLQLRQEPQDLEAAVCGTLSKLLIEQLATSYAAELVSAGSIETPPLVLPARIDGTVLGVAVAQSLHAAVAGHISKGSGLE